MIKKIFRIFFRILLFLLLLAIAAGLILVGLYLDMISKPNFIFGEAIDQVFQKTEEMFSVDSNYYMGDSFQIEGTIKMQLSSEEYHNKSLTDVEYMKKNQMLANLSKTDISYMYQQNKEKQQVYSEFNAKIGEEELYAEKKYIENSTQYFIVNNILSNYVNDGNNNYFESYGEEITTVDNISYLYHFIRDSIKNNITEEQIKSYEQDTYIGQDKINAFLISYRLTDKEYKRLLKAVLKDLKNDTRAKQILSAGCYHVDDLKVDTKKKYLDPKASYTFNIYVTKPFYKLEKYEFIYLKGDQKNIYTFEGDLKEGIFYYSENAELKYKADYSSTGRRTNIIVYNRGNQKVGTIKEEKDQNSLMLTITLDLEHYNYDITYISKNMDATKKSYTREDNLTFKYTKDKIIQMQGNIEVVSKINNEPKILVDTGSSILRSSLTDSENQKLESLKDTIRERLEK